MANAARSTRRTVALSRDVVLREALALVDEEAVEALTLRRLADRLGANPMAAYHHVRGKDAILDGIAELVTQDVDLVDETGAWQDRLRALCLKYRRAVLAHPRAMPIVVGQRHVSDSAMRAVGQSLRALTDAGLERREAVRWYRLISAFMIGFVSSVGADDEEAINQEPSQVAPILHELADVPGHLAALDSDADYLFGINELIARIENAVTSQPSTRRNRLTSKRAE